MTSEYADRQRLLAVGESTGVVTARYDAWGRLIHLVGDEDQTFAYDGLGRLIRQTEGGAVLDLWYAGGQVVLETAVGADQAGAPAAGAMGFYVLSPVDGQVILRKRLQRRSGANYFAMNEMFYALHDAQGSITAIADDMGIKQRFIYDVDGRVESRSGGGRGGLWLGYYQWQHLWRQMRMVNSGRSHGATRQVYNIYVNGAGRFYAPSAARWLTPDPATEWQAGNAYAAEQSLRFTDRYNDGWTAIPVIGPAVQSYRAFRNKDWLEGFGFASAAIGDIGLMFIPFGKAAAAAGATTLRGAIRASLSQVRSAGVRGLANAYIDQVPLLRAAVNRALLPALRFAGRHPALLAAGVVMAGASSAWASPFDAAMRTGRGVFRRGNMLVRQLMPLFDDSADNVAARLFHFPSHATEDDIARVLGMDHAVGDLLQSVATRQAAAWRGTASMSDAELAALTNAMELARLNPADIWQARLLQRQAFGRFVHQSTFEEVHAVLPQLTWHGRGLDVIDTAARLSFTSGYELLAGSRWNTETHARRMADGTFRFISFGR